MSTAAGQESIRTFSRQELEALITTAHLYGVKVAAHASNDSTAEDLIDLGVDSVEHGYDIRWDDSKCSRLSHSRTTWVPTLSAYYTISQGRGGTWERAASAFKAALAHGMSNIACGGDTGVFAHGENALEMKLMVRLGADWRQVLRWGTLGGWECIRSTRWEGEVGRKRVAGIGKLEETPETVGDNEVPFGAVRRGFAADLIATTGDLAGDFEGATSASSIVFVMKGGRIYKQYGRSVID